MLSASYRTSDHSSQSSDSDENNSDDDVAWQRKPSRSNDKQNVSSNGNIVNNTNGFTFKEKKRKVNNIWCSVLQDQTLSDVFGGFNMERKCEYEQDRTCESYDYRRKKLDTRPDVPFSENEPLVETVDSKEVFGVDTNKPIITTVSKKRWKPSAEEKKTARLIIRKLNEKKRELIYNVVKVLGIPKSMELLSMTENVEDNGGMMILNGSRRRTPGGVFFQLIKSDRNVTKAQYNEIFAENKQSNKKSANRKKKASNREVISMEIDEKLPDIPSVADAFLTKSNSTDDSKVIEADDSKVIEADAAETEEGEICD